MSGTPVALLFVSALTVFFKCRVRLRIPFRHLTNKYIISMTPYNIKPIFSVIYSINDITQTIHMTIYDVIDTMYVYQNTKELTNMQSQQAQAARLIRKELKENFKGTKFSVSSSSYSMGDSVSINWENGPTSNAVDEIVRKYQYGSFNGMEDIYEYTNTKGNLPQTKFVLIGREITESVYTEAFNIAKDHYSHLQGCLGLESMLSEPIDGLWNVRDFIFPLIVKLDLSEPLTLERMESN